MTDSVSSVSQSVQFSQFSLKVRGLRVGCSASFAPTTDFFHKSGGYERKPISPSSKKFPGSPRNQAPWGVSERSAGSPAPAPD